MGLVKIHWLNKLDISKNKFNQMKEYLTYQEK